MRPTATLAVLPALAALLSCTPATSRAPWAFVRETTPAFLQHVGAFDPAIATGPGGRLALTWVTRDADGADVWLALSADSGGRFGAPLRLNQRRGKVASYPESRPVAMFGPGGRLLVAWAAARDSGALASDIVVRASANDGAMFLPEHVLNDDLGLPNSPYHGFVTLAFTPAGRAIAAWIDGREAALAPGEDEPFEASIWASTSDDGGERWSPNARVAGHVCPCCRPTLRTSDGWVAVAYRGVRDSLRDPRLALSSDGGATFALDTLVSADGWKLPGCPSTGPAISFGRDGGWLAWFTGAPAGASGGGPGIYGAPWRRSGETGARRALADSLREPAQPMLAAMGPVTLLGVIAHPPAEDLRRAIALRPLGPAGPAGDWLWLGANARSAAMAAADARHASLAWIEQTEDGPRLRTVTLTRR